MCGCCRRHQEAEWQLFARRGLLPRICSSSGRSHRITPSHFPLSRPSPAQNLPMCMGCTLPDYCTKRPAQLHEPVITPCGRVCPFGRVIHCMTCTSAILYKITGMQAEGACASACMSVLIRRLLCAVQRSWGSCRTLSWRHRWKRNACAWRGCTVTSLGSPAQAARAESPPSAWSHLCGHTASCAAEPSTSPRIRYAEALQKCPLVCTLKKLLS